MTVPRMTLIKYYFLLLPSFCALIALSVLLPGNQILAATLDFDVFRLGMGENCVLVFGGIQGDEPGGFSAATLLATRYEISKGAIRVIPNLNFPSIIKRSRGLYGDMNRKFAILDEKDPEFGTVRRVQELIDDPSVRLVLNLHDGSGYYRPEYQDKLRNPMRWGQSVIIDQEELKDAESMGNLKIIADTVATSANKSLIRDMHRIHVHNTRTVEGDREMEKSLSYYAVRQNRAAFGLEASKELPVEERAYYHLLMVEEFLRLAGVEFSRDFELSPAGIRKALRENLAVYFSDNRIFLPLDNVRKNINFLPLTRESAQRPITSKPIMAVLPCEKDADLLCVHYGNRLLATIQPAWHKAADELEAVRLLVDGQEKLASFGHLIRIKDNFSIIGQPGYRVNAIGVDRGLKDESGILLKRADFDRRFSIDRAGTIYRVEVYRGKNFAGMFLVSFEEPDAQKKRATSNASFSPAAPGLESRLGY